MSDIRILSREAKVVPINEVQPHPGNPNEGDENAIRGSLQKNGQYRSILVQKSSGYILAGNTTWKTAQDNGATKVDIDVIDVNDEHARRIMLADNGVRRNATFEKRLLAELLGELPDLDGTGYDPGDMDDLRAELEELDTTLPPGAHGSGGDAGLGNDPDDNMYQRSSLDEKHAAYQVSDQRQIVLGYEGAQYIWVVEMLSVLGAKWATESNAATVLKLIEGATNEHAPAA